VFHLRSQNFRASANLEPSGVFGSPGMFGGTCHGANHINVDLVAILTLQLFIFMGQGCHGHVGL